MSALASPEEIHDAFRAFVQAPEFSCLAGKGVVRTDHAQVGVYGALGSRRSARQLAHDLTGFLAREDDGAMRAMVAVFPSTPPCDESAFEHLLWRQLQRLHDVEGASHAWDPGVSDDPGDPRFAFSFRGHALFVVGMHPGSSRMSRRFGWPALVFNPHSQFEHLRETGRFERLRERVREREVALQGSLNPNLADFGEQSEARQYSGRAVEAGWRCPFHRKDA